ncbi:S-adenosyl methyltransferase [Actinocorallia herbida]|uniref:S-adenosyl methyltransferase n=1 Tax=Actinocorallia herbida TaxID=58109 RepID=A0A3N1DCV4_9ACTN|nr:SAM-dependent methyltransferase [Actinocorallia herbida]ROO82533.1 S-adenosyl methyltransferase [Actinocorallia herbida]ROO91343.1 S-adenosyl methyltransferase [Actinocorallia herbida]
MDDPYPPHEIDTSLNSVAGMTDAARGGRNRSRDHQTVAEFARRWPKVPGAAPDDEEFPFRSVSHIVSQTGVDQFLNLGAGKPLKEGKNLHDLFPGQWLHTDADPEIRAVGGALFNSATTAYLEADSRDVDVILGSPEAQRILDLTRPVCVLASNLWHYVPGDEPLQATKAYMDAVPSGSSLVLAHACLDGLDPELLDGLNAVFAGTFAGGIWPRTGGEIRGFLDGLEVLDPGLVPPQHWRPDHAPAVEERSLPVLGAVAIKS